MKTDVSTRYRRAALLPRLVTGIVGVPLILAAAWWGGPWWIGLLGIIVVLGLSEFIRLHPRLSLGARATMTVGALALAIAIARLQAPAAVVVIGLASVVLLAAVVTHLRAPIGVGAVVWGPWAIVLVGLIYLGLPGGALVRWRSEAPFAALVWLLATIWMNDIAAYFVGLAAGRHKLAPAISPGKSWEGGISGVLAATLTAALGAAALGLPMWAAVVFGVVTSITSQVGDLFESAMKRRAGVKDSGTLLPGHGGILDRFDGLLVAAPVAYLWMWVFERL